MTTIGWRGVPAVKAGSGRGLRHIAARPLDSPRRSEGHKGFAGRCGAVLPAPLDRGRVCRYIPRPLKRGRIHRGRRMNSFELNKIIGAVLLGGFVLLVSSILAGKLVVPRTSETAMALPQGE